MIRNRILFKTSAGTWPVTLSEAKNYLRVVNTDDDAFIQVLINEMGQYGQQACNNQLVSTMSVKIVAIQPSEPSVANNEIELPYQNSTITINSVLLDGTALSSDEYTLGSDNVLRLDSIPDKGVLVVVEYSSTISHTISVETALLKLIADAYENRTEQGIESLYDVKANALKYFRSFINGSDLF